MDSAPICCRVWCIDTSTKMANGTQQAMLVPSTPPGIFCRAYGKTHQGYLILHDYDHLKCKVKTQDIWLPNTYLLDINIYLDYRVPNWWFSGCHLATPYGSNTTRWRVLVYIYIYINIYSTSLQNFLPLKGSNQSKVNCGLRYSNFLKKSLPSDSDHSDSSTAVCSWEGI